MKVCINAGHSSVDPGAVGRVLGLREADVAYNVGRKVCNYLIAVGIETVFIQHDNLATVTGTSNSFGADIFVSIHCNSAESTNAVGTETFAFTGSVKGRQLAGCVQNQLVDTLGTVDRGVKEAGFYVIKNTDAVACLAEIAFISNKQEEKMLASAGKQDDIARAIARGITDYMQGL